MTKSHIQKLICKFHCNFIFMKTNTLRKNKKTPVKPVSYPRLHAVAKIPFLVWMGYLLLARSYENGKPRYITLGEYIVKGVIKLNADSILALIFLINFIAKLIEVPTLFLGSQQKIQKHSLKYILRVLEIPTDVIISCLSILHCYPKLYNNNFFDYADSSHKCNML